METIMIILAVLGFTVLGFLLAEFQNAYLGKQVKDNTKKVFSFIGVDFTHKDFQRLIFAFLLGIGLMFILPSIYEMVGKEIDSRIIYFITGYSPSTVMLFFKKKIQNKIK